MSVKTEGPHAGEFIVSEANGTLSRETATLASGEKVADGTVLELAASKLSAAEGTANTAGVSDEVIVGVVIGNWDASASGTNADIPGVPYIARLAEVDGSLLLKASGSANTALKNALKALNVVSR